MARLTRIVCALFYPRLPFAQNVRNAPGLFCQGGAQSVTLFGADTPLGFRVSVHYGGVKVLCFDTLLQVLITKRLQEAGEQASERHKKPLPSVGPIRKQKTPAGMLALRYQDVVLPKTYGTGMVTVCPAKKDWDATASGT